MTQIAGIDEGTAASAIKTVASFVPSTPISTVIQYAGEMLDADVKRVEIFETFKRQLAGALEIPLDKLTPDLVDEKIEKMPDWLKKEWNEASDVTGKTGNFMVSMSIALAGGFVGSFIPVPLVGTIAGFAAGWFLSDIAVKEFRNAKGDVGGISTTNLTKLLKQASLPDEKGIKHAPDSTLVATLMLAIHRPEDNTEELEEMVQKHIAEKTSDPRKITELDAYISQEQDYFASLLGADVQAKFPAGTEVHDIVASYLRSPKDIDALMWKPTEFYDAIADDVSRQQIAQMKAQLAPHGKGIMNDDYVTQAPPYSAPQQNQPQRGHTV